MVLLKYFSLKFAVVSCKCITFFYTFNLYCNTKDVHRHILRLRSVTHRHKKIKYPKKKKMLKWSISW